jgi:hypothetical protein
MISSAEVAEDGVYKLPVGNLNIVATLNEPVPAAACLTSNETVCPNPTFVAVKCVVEPVGNVRVKKLADPMFIEAVFEVTVRLLTFPYAEPVILSEPVITADPVNGNAPPPTFNANDAVCALLADVANDAETPDNALICVELESMPAGMLLSPV